MAFARIPLVNDDGYRDIYMSGDDEALDVEIPIPAAGQPRGFARFLAQISIVDTAETPIPYTDDVVCYRKCQETGVLEPITDGYIDYSVPDNRVPYGSLVWPRGERWLFRPGDSLIIRGGGSAGHKNHVVVDWASE